MTRTVSRIIFWAPRIVCILFIPFLMLFSLDVFNEAKGFKEILIGLLFHNIPALTLIAILCLAWKWEWTGAVIFPALGAVYIWLAWGRFASIAYVLISGPLILMGILFALNWFNRKGMRPYHR